MKLKLADQRKESSIESFVDTSLKKSSSVPLPEGDVHQGSDLDLVIIKNTKQSFLRRRDRVVNLCDGEVAVEPLIYTEEEFKKCLRGEMTFWRR